MPAAGSIQEGRKKRRADKSRPVYDAVIDLHLCVGGEVSRVVGGRTARVRAWN